MIRRAKLTEGAQGFVNYLALQAFNYLQLTSTAVVRVLSLAQRVIEELRADEKVRRGPASILS